MARLVTRRERLAAVAASAALLAAGSFFVLNIDPDIAIDSFAVTDAVNVTGAAGVITCEIGLTSTDPIVDTGCTIKDANGKQYSEKSSAPSTGTTQSGRWTVNVPVPANANQGTWAVVRVFARDSTINKVSATGAEMLAAGDITQQPEAGGFLVQADLETVVTSTNEDNAGPVISATVVAPQSTLQISDQTFICANEVTDSSGVLDAGCIIIPPSGGPGIATCSSSAPVGGSSYECSVDLPAGLDFGTWSITAYARDTLGTRTYYPANETFTVASGGLTYDDCSTPAGGGIPLAIDLDSAGNAYVLGEAHDQVLQFIPESAPCGTAVALTIPTNGSPFNWAGSASKISLLAEGVVWDPNDGVVWFSQGGASTFCNNTTNQPPCDAALVNRSRVIRYTPGSPNPETGGTFQVYNIPGDKNEVHGILWDQARNWVWVAEAGFYSDFITTSASHEGSILAFDPDDTTIAKDSNFLPANWSTLGTVPGTGVLCDTGELPGVNNCFKRFFLPAAELGVASVPAAWSPSHFALDSGGFLWFTNFWGQSIGRLDPTTGAVQLYPLQAGIGTCGTGCDIIGAGPWEIKVSPDGLYVVWSEFFDATLARIPVARWDDSACHALDGNGDNPCVEEVIAPVDHSEKLVHSIAYASNGSLWFGLDSDNRPPLTGSNSIGFVDAAWTKATILDPSAHTPNFNLAGDKTYTGIAINETTGEIWANEFQPAGTARLAVNACVPDCAGKVCGFDGCSGSCGECVAFTNSYCQLGACACDVDTCGGIGATCGTPPDGCGGNLSCGTCGGGTPNCNLTTYTCEP